MSSYITSTSVVALTKLASEKKHARTICMTISDLQQVLSSSIDGFLAVIIFPYFPVNFHVSFLASFQVQDEFFQLPDIEGSCTKIVQMNKVQPAECEPALVPHLHRHNDYVLELCSIDAMLDAFNNDIVPKITQVRRSFFVCLDNLGENICFQTRVSYVLSQKMNRNHRSAISRFYSILDAQSCFLSRKVTSLFFFRGHIVINCNFFHSRNAFQGALNAFTYCHQSGSIRKSFRSRRLIAMNFETRQSCEVQGSRQMVQTSVTRLLRWNHRREDQVHVCECMAIPTHSYSPLRKRSLEIYIPPNISCFSRIVTHHILAKICSTCDATTMAMIMMK